ncbi:uncharacterized protein BX664DRAFT_312240 [Halteromyces radiatus]|uniref:uncharacterized protein n=1 Tax=Halteromyces radiatus TaxID=101107 RepID=UPI00221F585B|nr:uncharacterized protein BX664DRAFT_312240 [Halteromyces radiatus]KAI8097390.1 hypothetical protein BX664DRAFT_312240 [Halteromyces radiatus]
MTIESITIIGAGSIGGTVAFGLLANEDRFHIKEILFVDMSTDITQAQVIDLSDGSLGETIIRGATFKEAGRSDLIILAANTPLIEEESKRKWLLRSQRFIDGIVASMLPIQLEAFIIVAVEPVEMFVNQLRKTTSLKSERIMGVGHTSICNRRFQKWFKQCEKGMNGNNFNPWVIGTAKFPLIIWPQAEGEKQKEILEEIKRNWVGAIMFHSTLIKDKKGDAWFGTSASVIELVKILLGSDPNHTITTIVCTFHPSLDICTSFPVTINNQGITSVLEINLSDTEQNTLISTTSEYYTA